MRVGRTTPAAAAASSAGVGRLPTAAHVQRPQYQFQVRLGGSELNVIADEILRFPLQRDGADCIVAIDSQVFFDDVNLLAYGQAVPPKGEAALFDGVGVFEYCALGPQRGVECRGDLFVNNRRRIFAVLPNRDGIGIAGLDVDAADNAAANIRPVDGVREVVPVSRNRSWKRRDVIRTGRDVERRSRRGRLQPVVEDPIEVNAPLAQTQCRDIVEHLTAGFLFELERLNDRHDHCDVRGYDGDARGEGSDQGFDDGLITGRCRERVRTVPAHRTVQPRGPVVQFAFVKNPESWRVALYQFDRKNLPV